MVSDAMPPSKTEPCCGDNKSKIAAQLVHDGIGLKYRSCTKYVGQWYKEISTKEQKSGLIYGGGKTWRLSIVEKEPKNMKEVDIKMYMDVIAVPSREACRHTGLPHPRLATTRIYFSKDLSTLVNVHKVYKLVVAVCRTNLGTLYSTRDYQSHSSWCQTVSARLTSLNWPVSGSTDTSGS
jgi:hypothetical protein